MENTSENQQLSPISLLPTERQEYQTILPLQPHQTLLPLNFTSTTALQTPKETEYPLISITGDNQNSPFQLGNQIPFVALNLATNSPFALLQPPAEPNTIRLTRRNPNQHRPLR